MLGALLAPAPAVPSSQISDAARAAIVAAADELLAGEEVPGFSIAIAREGEMVFERGFGALRLDGSVPAEADTRYRIASISKAFTAVAVLQLVADGAIGLDDPAHRHCSTYPEKEPAPTIRHLLAHQSGIRHTNDREDTTIVGAPDALAAVIPRFANEDLEFAPGSDTLYTSIVS
jgi:CubicO group peptidase (beta-lactamase class C family)